ncbi:probable transcription factor At3g04930 [Mangifera indica]|uniref:probable transcription factor At3g04930 n=1 Tax=Mangifera indica TaxID=29780 RepID=UPI001CFA0C27|nr:probable transcription factor At3g04930 [Mangifera indica]
MASEQHDTVFPEEDQELDEDEEDSDEDELEENDDALVDEEDDEEVLNSAPVVSSVTPSSVSVAFPSASAIAVPSASAVTVALPPGDPDPKRQRLAENVVVLDEKKPVLSLPSPVPLPLPQQLDESRRLFQRLWTDEDEIELLQGFLDYTSQRGSAHHHDTALFYDQIKSKLQLDFNKNQLVEKLRRLKKKYRNVMSKISSGKDFAFKTAHDQATFEISRKIWSTTNVSVLDDEDANANHNNHINSSNEFKGNSTVFVSSNNNEEKNTPKSRKRSRAKPAANENVVVMNNNENVNVNGAFSGGNNNGIAAVVEETVRSCLSPLFKELLCNVMGGMGGRGIGGLPMNAVMPLGFGGSVGAEVVDEKWRKQQILELEVYSKRLELVQDQIKMALEELRSTGG